MFQHQCAILRDLPNKAIYAQYVSLDIAMFKILRFLNTQTGK
jgi:hypothetical protein